MSSKTIAATEKVVYLVHTLGHPNQMSREDYAEFLDRVIEEMGDIRSAWTESQKREPSATGSA